MQSVSDDVSSTPQLFYGPFSRTTPVSQCQKRTSGLYGVREDCTEADTQTIRLGATPSGLTSAHLHHPLHFFTGWMPFLPPNQQCQSTEGKVMMLVGKSESVYTSKNSYLIHTQGIWRIIHLSAGQCPGAQSA